MHKETSFLLCPKLTQLTVNYFQPHSSVVQEEQNPNDVYLSGAAAGILSPIFSLTLSPDCFIVSVACVIVLSLIRHGQYELFFEVRDSNGASVSFFLAVFGYHLICVLPSSFVYCLVGPCPPANKPRN